MSDAVLVPRYRPFDAAHPPLETAAGTELYRVEVHAELGPTVLDAWRVLEDEAAVSPYQTRAWLLPWMETLGRSADVEPMLAVAYDRDGHPLTLLPFGIVQRGAVRMAEFLGGKHSNFNMGLFRPGPRWTAEAIRALLDRVYAASPVRVDAFALRNQPFGWEGTDNPLAALPNQPSPSFGHKAGLSRDPDAFFESHLSRESRKKLRQKTRRLELLGPVRHRCARGPDDIRSVVDALVEQRSEREAALGLPAGQLSSVRDFLLRAAMPECQQASVELHALYCGETIVATFAGAGRRERFCGMLMSFTLDPAFARHSPGEVLLWSVIRAKCIAGCAVFDLGVGEARYKEGYTPIPEPLFDCLIPMTALGRAYVVGERLRLRLKRSVKQSPRAWATVQRLRRLRRPKVPRPESVDP